MEFISTIGANNFKFYEHLNDVIQKEPLDMLDPETRGLFASIGIEKGKPFNPDARMKKILTDAVAIGNGDGVPGFKETSLRRIQDLQAQYSGESARE